MGRHQGGAKVRPLIFAKGFERAETMKKWFIFVTGFWMFFGLLQFSVSAGGQPEGDDALPSIVLPVPESAVQRAYLGLTEKKIFSLSDIKRKVLIVEIFSMYCPHCQAEAPIVNELYRKIDADPLLRKDIGIIGIGVGNSSFEVNIFREKYKIPFPLFPDPDFKIYDDLGKVRTPYFLGIMRGIQGAERVFWVQTGRFGDVDEFLHRILQESGMNERMTKGKSK